MYFVARSNLECARNLQNCNSEFTKNHPSLFGANIPYITNSNRSSVWGGGSGGPGNDSFRWVVIPTGMGNFWGGEGIGPHSVT